MKYIFFCTISIYFFVLTYSSSADDFNQRDLFLIPCFLVVTLCAQILISILIGRTKRIKNILLSIFALANIVTGNLILNGEIQNLPWYVLVMGVLAGVFILITLINIIDESQKLAKLLTTLVGLSIAFLIADLFLSDDIENHETTSTGNIQLVDFKRKPNVYFISFDSIIPKALLNKYMGFDTTDYHEVLDANFRRFNNFFADRVPTGKSLNSLLAMDIQHWDKLAKNEQLGYFTGVMPSPLFEIFKHNGYETNTLSFVGELNKRSGPHVDNININNKGGACQFVEERLKKYTFWGVCALAKDNWLKRSIEEYLNTPSSESYDDRMSYLLSKMRAGTQRTTPQIFVAYFAFPGHTWKAFNINESGHLEKYRKRYLVRSKTLASYIERLVRFIKQEDPDAVLYVFGDHGPFLTKTDISLEIDNVFFVQDRFGIYGGIYPMERCSESFTKSITNEYMTISQGADMIINCLSGGQTAFNKLLDYHLPWSEKRAPNRYENYLYE